MSHGERRRTENQKQSTHIGRQERDVCEKERDMENNAASKDVDKTRNMKMCSTSQCVSERNYWLFRYENTTQMRATIEHDTYMHE